MSQSTRCAGVIVLKENAVLLVQHLASARLPQGTYGFPAGRMEEGETPEQTAVRELYEETGLKTTQEDLQKLCVKNSTLSLKKGPENFEYHIFVCTNFTGILTSSEKTVPEFIVFENLASLENTFGDTQELVDAALTLLS